VELGAVQRVEALLQGGGQLVDLGAGLQNPVVGDPAVVQQHPRQHSKGRQHHNVQDQPLPLAAQKPAVLGVLQFQLRLNAVKLALEVGDIHLAVAGLVDRKSTRLNSSHVSISYAVFCLKNKTRTAA